MVSRILSLINMGYTLSQLVGIIALSYTMWNVYTGQVSAGHFAKYSDGRKVRCY